MEVQEQLNKKRKRLQDLKQQEVVLSEKIKKIEEEIEKYETIQNQKEFNELKQVLVVKGLSVGEILQAVQKGDFMYLQKKL